MLGYLYIVFIFELIVTFLKESILICVPLSKAFFVIVLVFTEANLNILLK